LSCSGRYETSAHLWLVLEYCVGGDLLTLLRQVGDKSFLAASVYAKYEFNQTFLGFPGETFSE